MALKHTKTRLAAAGASLALIAAVAGAGMALPSEAAWAATTPTGPTQLQQDASPTPTAKPGRPKPEGRTGNQQREQHQQAFQNALAGRLGVSADQLREAQKQARIDLINQAVSEGRIDQERANRMIQAIQSGQGPRAGQGPRGQGQGHRGAHGGPGQRPGGPGMMRGGPQVVANILGITPQELRTELQAGKTLAQIGEAKGISRDTLKAKLLEAHKQRIDEAVAAGRLTAEQAQAMTERATANIDAMLDRTPGQRQGPRGPRTGG